MTPPPFPAANLAAKAQLYPAPKRLQPWDALPAQGHYLPDAKLWSHEIDFWGGDLASTQAKLGYIQNLGADVLYLNPIHLAYTNHKYDALDYLALSPEFGSRDDFRPLAETTHAHGMKLVLDGVFKHMGRNSPGFQAAQADANSAVCDWFVFGDAYPDTARLATTLPDPAQRRLAQLLQFTLPGAPNLYHGSGLGMAGGDDPEMRAPMRWDLVDDDNPDLAWTRQLTALRKTQRALRVGNLRAITSHRLLAFERRTDRVADSVFMIANPGPGPTEITKTVLTGNSRLMNPFPMIDLLGTATTPVRVHCGLLSVSAPAGGVLVLQPEVQPAGAYTSYKRVP